MAKKSPTKPNDEPASGPCIGCGTVLDDVNFCYGCKSFICSDCDQMHPSFLGPHGAEAHDVRGTDENYLMPRLKPSFPRSQAPRQTAWRSRTGDPVSESSRQLSIRPILRPAVGCRERRRSPVPRQFVM